MGRVPEQVVDPAITSEMWMEIWRAQYRPFPASEKNYRLHSCLDKQRRKPLFIWFVSIVQVIVFIAELARNWSLTGSPIQIKPSFNPAIGPSVFVLINMGARYPPCMQSIPDITSNRFHHFSCPNYTGSPKESSCTLGELCGFTRSTPPNQWYRFILPIFLHSGFIHISLNLLTQLIVGTFIERKIGTFRVSIVYCIAGIFGLMADANFAPDGFATVGCSGAVFGMVGLYLLTIIYEWRDDSCRELVSLLIDLVINFGLGLLPSIGNFNHMGGFVMGLLLGLTILDQPTRFSWIKWWVWSIVRFICLIAATVVFLVSIENVYSRRIQCSWCKYLDCLPIRDWCDVGYLRTSTAVNTSVDITYNI